MSSFSHTGDFSMNPWQFVSVTETGTYSVNPDNKESERINERLEKIEQRLAIIIPDETLHKEFPALREAYEHYKLIEKLVSSKKKNV